MKILFTSSKNPNFFSKLIMAVEGTKYSHCLIETDLLFPGTSDPFVLQSTWSQGFVLTPKSLAIGTKETLEFEDGLPFDWKFTRKLLEQFQGTQFYGWPQVLGRALGIFKIKPPKWLLARYSTSAYCSKLILLLWAKAHKPCDLDLNTTGPRLLLEFLQKP